MQVKNKLTMEPAIAKQRNLLWSIMIIGYLTCLVYLLYYPPNNGLGDKFGVGIMLLVTRYFGYWFGIVILLARLFSIVKHRQNLLYVLAGCLNVLLGLVSIILFLNNQMNIPFFHLYLINMAIGIIIIADIFLFN